MATPRYRQRKFEWRQARVAALIAVGVLLLLYGTWRVGEIFDVFAERYQLSTLVPSALGLREGAPVTLAGQRIGQVERIDFIPMRAKRAGNNLHIVLAVNERVQEQIRADSRAFLRTQGLLGDKYVDIQPGTPGAQVLQPGDTIPAGRSLDVEEFITQASTALEQANAIIADLRTITDGLKRGEGTLGRFLTDEDLYRRMLTATDELAGMLTEFNRADGTIGRLARDPAVYQRLHAALARVDSIGTLVLHGQGSLGRLLRDDALFSGFLTATARADSAMSGLNQLLGRMGNGQGSLQKLLADPELYDQMLKAVVDLQTLLNDVRTSPDRYKPNLNVRVF